MRFTYILLAMLLFSCNEKKLLKQKFKLDFTKVIKIKYIGEQSTYTLKPLEQNIFVYQFNNAKTTGPIKGIEKRKIVIYLSNNDSLKYTLIGNKYLLGDSIKIGLDLGKSPDYNLKCDSIYKVDSVVASSSNQIDSTLKNGYFVEGDGMISDGHYINGKKEGIWRTYYNFSIGKVLSVSYFEKGEGFWSAYPSADMYRILPIKGMYVKYDSTLIEAPHINGSIWYRGHFKDSHTPYGKHEVFYPNGRLRASFNYDTDTITNFNEYGKLIHKGNIKNFPRTRRINHISL